VTIFLIQERYVNVYVNVYILLSQLQLVVNIFIKFFFTPPSLLVYSLTAMPELPDIEVYIECLKPRVLGEPLEKIRIAHPFLLRTARPPIALVEGKRVAGMSRAGKRLVFALDGDLFLVLHLMIAGRLHWKEPGAKIPGKFGLAAFDFAAGTLLLTEAGSKRRASLHLVSGRGSLAEFDRGGIEVLEADPERFTAALLRESHTLKRALIDPGIFSGIGNSYSDEILHRARLSPIALTKRLTGQEIERLHDACRDVLTEWTERIRKETGDGFPEHVTAFREGMAVHGRFGLPCPACGAPVQRIVYAENECDYCPSCQTGGRILADRALSRLLKGEWPRTLQELEELDARKGSRETQR
jgi:formamidopyrimidine-DNA glycosylase